MAPLLAGLVGCRCAGVANLFRKKTSRQARRFLFLNLVESREGEPENPHTAKQNAARTQKNPPGFHQQTRAVFCYGALGLAFLLLVRYKQHKQKHHKGLSSLFIFVVCDMTRRSCEQ